MTSTVDLHDFLAQLKQITEERVLEQARRHTRVGAHADWGQVVDIQIGQEREMLKQLAEKCDDDEQYEASGFIHALIEEWLPSLAKELRGRR